MLSQHQIDQFHSDGLLVLRGVFEGEELAALQRAAEAVSQEGLEGRGMGHGYQNVEGRRQYYRTDGGLIENYAAFRLATVHPALLSAVGQCMGHAFMPINDSLVMKLPRSGVPIPWHQDPPYQGLNGRRETFGVPNFDCDIYLDAATLENGCLFGLAGHHLMGHVELERFEDREIFERVDAVPLEMNPGDVLLHAISAPHGSKANFGDSIRRVFYVHYMAREVLEALHPDWIGIKRGFAESDIAAAQAMIEARREAGWSVPATEQVHLTAAGFAFAGRPTTPPWHWEALIAGLEPRQLEAARMLAGS